MSSTPYDRQSSFAQYSAENPGEPHSGATLDAEFNAVKVAIDDTQQNLALIQDDDGALKRGSVGKAQFDSSVTLGFGAPEQWASGQIYTADTDTVFYQSRFYIANTTHTSTASFDASKWDLIADFTLAVVISDGSITSAKLADGAVDSNKIAEGSISNTKLATGAVSNTKIADSTIKYAKFDTADIAAPLANLIIPAGLGPLPWSGSSAPSGWVLTGGTYSRATYPALWAHAQAEIALGNTLYGAGDGSTTFTIASMAGRVPAGKEASASLLTSTWFGGNSTVLGAVGGSEKNALSATNQLPQFTPSGTITNGAITINNQANLRNAAGDNNNNGGGGGPFGALSSLGPNLTASQAASTFAGVAIGSASPSSFRTTQPTIIVNYIIKAH